MPDSEIQETGMTTSNQRIVEFLRICNFIKVPFQDLVPLRLLFVEGNYRTVNPTNSLLSAGQPGFPNTPVLVKNYFCLPTLEKCVADSVNSCQVCAQNVLDSTLKAWIFLYQTLPCT